jgi:16S rRNA (guanine527-N7)-methyltransferase
MEALERLIEEGLAHFAIEGGAEVSGRLLSYAKELERWNRTINLVGLKRAERIVADLLYDAFFLHTWVTADTSLLDLGSGAGVVSVPLAILNPGKKVFSVDKSLKKTQFQRHVKRLLGLGGLEIIRGRIEDVGPLHVEALVAKAFGPASSVLGKAGRHLAPGGFAFIVKGKGEGPSEHRGFFLKKVVPYSLPESDKTYQLFIYKKVS